MVKEKGSANDLAKLYYGCPLFKKYCRHNFWRGNAHEYNDLRYCRKYIYKCTQVLILRYMLQYFSLPFILVLYTSPCFIKFTKSGFIRYLDFHFLLLFYNHSFFSSSIGIKAFIEKYFEKYIREGLKKDLLLCISECLDEQALKNFNGEYTSRLKYVYSQGVKRTLRDKSLLIKIIVGVKRGPCSLNCFAILDNIYKSVQKFTPSKDIRYLKNYPLVYSSNASVILSFFLVGPALKPSFCTVGQINLARTNRASKVLFKVVEVLDDFVNKAIKVGLHKNINIIFEDNSSLKLVLCKKIFKNFNSLLKSFNKSFFEHRHKNQILSTSRLFSGYK